MVRKKKASVKAKLPERVYKNAGELIGEVDDMVDNWPYLADKHPVADALANAQVSVRAVNKTIAHIEPLLQEVSGALAGTDPQLVEGYNHYNPETLKRYRDFLAEIKSDCQNFISDQRVAKPRKKRAVNVSRVCSKVKYLRYSEEYGVTSHNPETLYGAQIAFLFNTKQKTVTYLRANAGGFIIKGSTVLNIDEKVSRVKKIGHRTEEWLSKFRSGNNKYALNAFESIKRQGAQATGRINKDTVILRVERV